MPYDMALVWPPLPRLNVVVADRGERYNCRNVRFGLNLHLQPLFRKSWFGTTLRKKSWPVSAGPGRHGCAGPLALFHPRPADCLGGYRWWVYSQVDGYAAACERGATPASLASCRRTRSPWARWDRAMPSPGDTQPKLRGGKAKPCGGRLLETGAAQATDAVAAMLELSDCSSMS